jgi:tetratricopeptide (TPR) repeat protein
MDQSLRNAIGRIEVTQGDRHISRGTGFLVADGVLLTALHVVADREKTPSQPHPGTIHVQFPHHRTEATVYEPYWSRDADWVLLRCVESPPNTKPLALADLQASWVNWQTYGFPDAQPRDGMVMTGTVENCWGDFEGVRVFQLYSKQAAAGDGAPVKGLSGGPVIVQNTVVGVLRVALWKQGRAVAGTLYACPIAAALESCRKALPELVAPIVHADWDFWGTIWLITALLGGLVIAGVGPVLLSTSSPLWESVAVFGGLAGAVLGWIMMSNAALPLLQRWSHRLTRSYVKRATVWAIDVAAIVGMSVAASTYNLRPIYVTSNELSTNMYFITLSALEREYEETHGQPLKEDVKQKLTEAIDSFKGKDYKAAIAGFEALSRGLALSGLHNNLGVLYALTGRYEEAQKALTTSVGLNGNNQELSLNLGFIEEAQGKLTEAVTRMKRATDLKRTALVRFATPRVTDVNGQEAEPNDDLNQTNAISLGTKVLGSISELRDVDVYQIKTSRGPRDIYQAALENGSTTLRPVLRANDKIRHQVCRTASSEPLTHIECAFSADPDSTYYIQTSGALEDGFLSVLPSLGSYALVVTPLKRYDRYEPNDDFPDAKPLSLGTRIDANIMDERDADWYVVKTATAGGPMTARLESDSTNLVPVLEVYDGVRHLVNSAETDEPLTRIECPFTADPQATYYVKVSSKRPIGLFQGSSGPYKLTVR